MIVCPECGWGTAGPSEHGEEECLAHQECERDGHLPADPLGFCPRCGILYA